MPVRSSKVCQTTQLLSYQWLLSAAVCLGGKITPCSLTAGSLSTLNYTKLVQHISLPEQEPECCGTCLTRSKQCSLNQLGMMYLEPAAVCLRHDAQNIKTKWVSNSFIMHCENNLCRNKTVCTICGPGFFCAGHFWTIRSGRTARDSVTLFKKPQLTLFLIPYTVSYVSLKQFGAF